MADEDRRLVQLADQVLVVVDDLADGELAEIRMRRASQVLDRPILERPRWRNNGVALSLVACAKQVPRRRRQPGSVDEHDGPGHGEPSDETGARTRQRLPRATTCGPNRKGGSVGEVWDVVL